MATDLLITGVFMTRNILQVRLGLHSSSCFAVHVAETLIDDFANDVVANDFLVNRTQLLRLVKNELFFAFEWIKIKVNHLLLFRFLVSIDLLFLTLKQVSRVRLGLDGGSEDELGGWGQRVALLVHVVELELDLYLLLEQFILSLLNRVVLIVITEEALVRRI